MAKIVEVIESKRWKNTKTGRIVSIYGACPWDSDSEKQDWIMETVGYTWRLDNGTVGLCRVPAKTKEEALQIMERYNNNAW
jgi:pyruvoyl-dependent arginine decarboxylase (PvlArgDC)